MPRARGARGGERLVRGEWWTRATSGAEIPEPPQAGEGEAERETLPRGSPVRAARCRGREEGVDELPGHPGRSATRLSRHHHLPQVRSGSQLEDGARLRIAGHHTAEFPAAPSPEAVEPGSGEDGKPDAEVCATEAGEPRSRC